MKIILQQDIKGKGKELDIIDVANGYGNFLIAQGKAALATELNLAMRQRDIDRAQDEANDFLLLCMRRDEELRGKVFTFYRKPMPDGSTNKAVTKKEVLAEINKLYEPYSSIEAKQLSMSNIKMFGKHEVFIKFHKQVITPIFIEVKSE